MATKTATSTQIDLNDASGKWTDDEIDAMKEHAKELKTAKRRSAAAADAAAEGEADVLAKIKEMPGPDRVLAERIHAIVKSSAPELASRTWYGMPAYTKGGKVVCFFKAASKFKGALRDLRLRGAGRPRRRRDVADVVGAGEADPRRREAHRRAGEEGRRLTR